MLQAFRRPISFSSKRFNVPPKHFEDLSKVPSEFNQAPANNSLQQSISTSYSYEQDGKKAPSEQQVETNSYSGRIFRDIGLLISTAILGYLAIDNFQNRVRLEKLNKEITTINLKSLQSQQISFANARKKRDVQILEERKENTKRNFRMAMHIALLRKQLKEAGLTPVSVDNAIREYEHNVKIDNSYKNVSGQILWLDDESEMKPYLPDVHEYDRKKSDSSVVR